MSYANRRKMSSNRTVAIIIVAILHVLLGYALVTGLAYNAIKKVADDLKTFDVEDEPPPPPDEPPPPPEDIPQVEPPPMAPPPMVRSTVSQNTVQTSVIPNPAPSPVPLPVRVAPPPPLPPPAPRVSQAAKAKGSLPGLFSTDDYPGDAIRSEQQGTTAVRLTIDGSGRVSGCSVTSSSGSRSLDDATCRIIRSRARYTPAKDQAGSPISDTDSVRIRWVLPAD